MTTTPQRLLAGKTLVAVIDVQERLVAAMPPERMNVVSRKIDVLLQASARLGAPVVATEQYPKGLGPTIPSVAARLTEASATLVEKTAFSAAEIPAFAKRLYEVAPLAIVVVGMEAHVCVYQTVRDLVRRGVEVHVPVDAVISRHDDDRTTGLALCERAGAMLSTMETIVFDWLGRAGTDEFRAISKLVR
jgi:nicotinamidase-related amidase